MASKSLIINISVTGEPPFTPDITRQDLIKVSAVILATLASCGYKDGVMRVMAAGPGCDVGSKRILWMNVNPYFVILLKLLDGLRADTGQCY
jgi:hypothetical protein